MAFYCSNCELHLQTDDDNKRHFKTDFHRYNIKRKLLSLNPVSEDVFNTSTPSPI